MAISNITSSTTRYTVVNGDTFSEIAAKCISVGMPGYSGLTLYNAGINKLKSFNPDIENINLIYVGQVIILQGTPATKTTNNTQRAKITNFGLQSGTTRTVFATWVWTKSNTDHYEVKWKYSTGDGVAFSGVSENVTEKQSVYSSAPENAISVTFYVRPISKTYKKKDKDVKYWTADWTAARTYRFSDNPPSAPSTPTDVTIKDSKLTVKLSDLSSLNATQIQFQIYKNDTVNFKTANAKISATGTVSYSCSVSPGCDYKIRCRSVRDGVYSDWSTWSDNFSSEPPASDGIYDIRALTELADQSGQFVVGIYWYAVDGADSYEIQYTNYQEYFDSNPDGVTSKILGSSSDPTTVSHMELSGLSGGTYYFRVRSIKNNKNSAWSEIETIILGKAPTAPTTWSSTTTVVTGESLILYWVHNSADGSSQTQAILELTVNEDTQLISIQNTTDPDERDKTSFYTIDTSQYEEGVKIKWRVKTAGILTNDTTGEYEYSEFSTLRTVDVYARPTLSLTVTNAEENTFSELTAFPIHIEAEAGPGNSNQTPIGYSLTVSANESYETIDNIGNKKYVTENSSIYTKYFDTSVNPLNVILTAGDLDLANNISYTITCSVCMNSGLTTEESVTFTVAWEDSEDIWPNAEIAYDNETYTTSIKAYCSTESGTLIEGITLSVYRREFDGSFTELATGLANTDETYITDPHPSLDYARYRIVAVKDDTGLTSYYDVPGFPINEPSAILQWDEEYTSFNINNDEGWEEPYWSGSLLKLPYNLDVSDTHEKDTELIQYIGREHPVGYYGTQLGHTSSWSVEIEKDDSETLYALRRLSRWMGNVYVREPSGSGYWADVKVSFSQTHCELTIPVTLEITRVEGGI